MADFAVMTVHPSGDAVLSIGHRSIRMNNAHHSPRRRREEVRPRPCRRARISADRSSSPVRSRKMSSRPGCRDGHRGYGVAVESARRFDNSRMLATRSRYTCCGDIARSRTCRSACEKASLAICRESRYDSTRKLEPVADDVAQIREFVRADPRRLVGQVTTGRRWLRASTVLILAPVPASTGLITTRASR